MVDDRDFSSTWPTSGCSTAPASRLRLTPTEWALLEVLVRHPGKLVTQRQLLQEVWGPPYGDESNYLRVHLAAPAREAGARPRPSPLPHHRARHGLPLRGPCLSPFSVRISVARATDIRTQTGLRRGVWMAVWVIRWTGRSALSIATSSVTKRWPLRSNSSSTTERARAARRRASTPSRATSDDTWIHGPSTTLRASTALANAAPAGMGDALGGVQRERLADVGQVAGGAAASKTSVDRAQHGPGRQRRRRRRREFGRLGRGRRAVDRSQRDRGPGRRGGGARRAVRIDDGQRQALVVTRSLLGRDGDELPVVHRLGEAGRDRPVAEPVPAPAGDGLVGQVGEHVDTGDEAAVEAVRPGHVVVVDLVRRVGGRVEGLHRVRHGRESRGWPVTVDHRGCRSRGGRRRLPFRVVSPALRTVARACALAAVLAATAVGPGRGASAQRVPTVPQTSCTSVVHIGDSLSVGLDSSAYVRDPDARISVRYDADRRRRRSPGVSGGRSVIEHLDGQEDGEVRRRADPEVGFHGCWVIALGTNDAANVDAGSQYGYSERIDRMMAIIGDDPVLWVDAKTTRRTGDYGSGRTCACSTRRWPRPTPATRA